MIVIDKEQIFNIIQTNLSKNPPHSPIVIDRINKTCDDIISNVLCSNKPQAVDHQLVFENEYVEAKHEIATAIINLNRALDRAASIELVVEIDIGRSDLTVKGVILPKYFAKLLKVVKYF